MRTTQSLSITLPLDMAQMVKDKVASGKSATESEVIRDGLRTLAARDAAVERWLRDEVAASCDEMNAHPERGIGLDEAFDSFDRRVKNLAAKS